MKSVLYFGRLKRIAVIALAAVILTSCEGPKSKSFLKSKYLDNTPLFNCLSLIDSGEVHRGMDTNALNNVFGKTLRYPNNHEAVCILTVPRGRASEGVQLPPLWEIRFSIDDRGFVSDFVITKPEGK